MSTQAKTFSAEGRFAKNPTDFFETPYPLARAALDILPADFAPERALDPAAGRGVWGAALRVKWPELRLLGLEIDPTLPAHPDYNLWHTGDYLHWERTCQPFDLVATNPPYSHPSNRSLAEHFVQRALGMTANFGYVMMLLKTEFVGSSRGRRLFVEHRPAAIYQSVRRLPLMTTKYGQRTNTIEYAIFLWQKCVRQETRFHWFDWLDGKLTIHG